VTAALVVLAVLVVVQNAAIIYLAVRRPKRRPAPRPPGQAMFRAELDDVVHEAAVLMGDREDSRVPLPIGFTGE
jgi:hypothetical protein